jgi:RimJ/RimL family protein N-acetyltransferase
VAWLPDDFVHPTRVDLVTGHHLRTIRGDDVSIDYPAVMKSQVRLWSMFGARWKWPPPTMTVEHDRDDLDRHEREIEAHESFNYCILDDEETELFGCVYIDPPDDDSIEGIDAEICWWVVDDAVGTGLEAALERFVPQWITQAWPFTNPRLGLPPA